MQAFHVINYEKRVIRHQVTRVAAGIFSVFLFSALVRGAGMRRELEFPHELVHFEPATQGVIFAGTGKDTWDRKIRERSYILREGKTWRV